MGRFLLPTMQPTDTPAQVLPQAVRVLRVGILVNAVYMVVELLVGWREQSYGLMADAGFNLCDLFSMALALLWLRGREAGSHHARRLLRRLDAGVATAGAVVTLVAAALLMAGGVRRFALLAGFDGFPLQSETDGGVVCLTAVAGIVVNGLTALLLASRLGQGLNARNALRVLGVDALVSVLVALGGLAAWVRPACGVVDPALGVFIAVLVVASMARLLYRRLLAAG